MARLHIHNRGGVGSLFACDYTINDETVMRYRNVQLLKLHDIDQQIMDNLRNAHPGSSINVYHVVRCMR